MKDTFSIADVKVEIKFPSVDEEYEEFRRGLMKDIYKAVGIPASVLKQVEKVRNSRR